LLKGGDGPTVDQDVCAVEVRRFLRCEEHGDGSDLFRHALATKGALRDHVGHCIQRTWDLTEVAFGTVTESLSRAVLAPVMTDDELLLQLATRWQIRDLMIEEIERAQATGDLHGDVAADVLVDQIGPILFHLLRLWTAGSIDDDGLVTEALQAVDLCLLAVSPSHQRARLLAHLNSR
jgi:hypothetical protein